MIKILKYGEVSANEIFARCEQKVDVADIVSGDKNPSGHLTMSFPYSVGQVPVHYNSKNTGRPPKSQFKAQGYSSSYVDIRNAPLFPFGYGLSYTEFEYSDLKVLTPSVELGGVVNSLTWDFGTYDQIEADGTIVNKDYLLKDIIVEAVHEFGREPYHNIIVNDLDTFGVELMEYRGREPMYMLSNQSTLEVSQMTLDGSATYKYYKRQKSDTWIRQNIRLDEIEKKV